ncbi:hypothetical protein RyT2_10950 [Pseudolactococcus yaeyamensis]
MDKYTYSEYLKAISKIPKNNQLAHTIGLIAFSLIVIIILLFFIMLYDDYLDRDMIIVLLIPLPVLAIILIICLCSGGFRTSKYKGMPKSEIQKTYLTQAKKIETSESIPIYNLNTTNSQEINGHVSGGFLFVYGSVETSSKRDYRYVVKETDGYQFLNLKDEYSLSSDKQVFINETTESPALVIKKQTYEDKRFDKLLREFNSSRWSHFKPLSDEKFIFNVPKGSVVNSFEAK